MSGKLYLGIRVDPTASKKIEITGVNMESKVQSLKQTAGEYADLPPDNLELVFCGTVLKDSSTLTAAGLRPGVTVHVLRKNDAAPLKKANAFSESDVLHLVSAFKNATKNPNYRTALQRLSRPAVLENIMVATPGLRDDPVALAMIQDPELLSQLCDAGTVRRVVEAHPALAEAAHYIVAVVHEEAASSSTSTNPQSGFFYSLEALSDEEDMESSQSSDSQPQAAEPSFNSAITSMQLAAALAAAQSQAASSAGGASDATATTQGGLITSQMLGQALGQAFAASSPNTAPAGAPPESRPALSDLEATSRRLAQHLQQMRELGLRDDTLNLQALQATDWNVQEAINLVFSGAMADMDPETD